MSFGLSAREQLIMVLECRVSNKARARVEQRIADGICVGQREDGSECASKARCRGLCSHCERVWRNTRVRMAEQDAVAYDSRLIRAGRLLKPLETRVYMNKSVYKKLA